MNNTITKPTDYDAFLERKTQIASGSGFEPLWMPDFLFPFQRIDSRTINRKPMSDSEYGEEWRYILEERRGILSDNPNPAPGPLKNLVLESLAQKEARKHMDSIEKAGY